jgi:glycosyltransferase involved in cell wall biosynthesis
LDGHLARPGDPTDLAQKIAALLALPAEKRRQMGCAGRRKVQQRYSWSGIGARLEEIYEQGLGTSAVRGRPNNARVPS